MVRKALLLGLAASAAAFSSLPDTFDVLGEMTWERMDRNDDGTVSFAELYEAGLVINKLCPGTHDSHTYLADLERVFRVHCDDGQYRRDEAKAHAAAARIHAPRKIAALEACIKANHPAQANQAGRSGGDSLIGATIGYTDDKVQACVENCFWVTGNLAGTFLAPFPGEAPTPTSSGVCGWTASQLHIARNFCELGCNCVSDKSCEAKGPEEFTQDETLQSVGSCTFMCNWNVEGLETDGCSEMEYKELYFYKSQCWNGCSWYGYGADYAYMDPFGQIVGADVQATLHSPCATNNPPQQP